MELINEKYQIIRKFETLGFANTFIANNINDNTKVIIKELVINKIKDWKSLELFEREGKTLKNLKHDSIPKYIDTFHIDTNEGSSFYLVQEYIDGKSLQERIDDGERFTIDTVFNITETILKTLIYLESLNPPVIHRDIKPSNIMMKYNNTIYLIDFGAIQNVGNINNVGTTVVGTTGFMAPEQLMGKASSISDLYSLGVTIITLLSHKNPIDLPIKSMKLQYYDFINANIDDNFKFFIDKLIEPDSEKRIQSAQNAINMFYKIKNGESLIAKPVESDLKSISKPSKKFVKEDISDKKLKLSIVLIFMILVLFLGGALFFFLLMRPMPVRTPEIATASVAKEEPEYKLPVQKSSPTLEIKGSLKTCINQSMIKEQISNPSDLKSFECKNLNLTSNDIKDISKMKSLTRVDLSNNKIDNLINIGKLSNLKSLVLNSNNISNIEPLKNLTNLENLYIYTNKISDITPLKNLKKLKTLAIFSNKLVDITPIKHLTNLENLTISFNKLEDLTPLSELINLKKLDLNYNKIENITPLKNLIKLTNLQISNNQISDISSLKNLKDLEWLNISSNKVIDISILKNLTNIKYLLINNNDISDISSLEYLTDLETLWAGQNKIKTLPDLKNLKRIKRLSLWNNKISDLSPLKDIEIKEELDVHGNNIGDFSSVSHIKNIKK